MNADDRTLGYDLVGADHFLHLTSGEPVSGDIDDVVGAPHDEKIAILVEIPTVTGQVVAGKGRHIGTLKTLRILPHADQAAWRQWLLDDYATLLHRLGCFAFSIQQLHVEPRYRHAGAAGFGW